MRKRNTTSARAMEVAKEIQRQLGSKTFFMLGAKHLTAIGSGVGAGHPGLMFQIRGSKVANHISIVLDPDDTYTIAFAKIGRDYKAKVVKEFSGVHFDQLHGIIEKTTGLYTRMNPGKSRSTNRSCRKCGGRIGTQDPGDICSTCKWRKSPKATKRVNPTEHYDKDFGNAAWDDLLRGIDGGSLNASVEFLDRVGSWPSEDHEVRKYQAKANKILLGRRGMSNNPSSAKHLFVGIMPGGISYADKRSEEDGDYKKVAFLPYDTLDLRVYDSKNSLLPIVKSHAKTIIDQRGKTFEISASGQTVTLGRKSRNPGGRKPPSGGTLPPKGKCMLAAVYESAVAGGLGKRKKKAAAKQAWCAVKRQYKKVGATWKKRKRTLGPGEQPPGCTPLKRLANKLKRS